MCIISQPSDKLAEGSYTVITTPNSNKPNDSTTILISSANPECSVKASLRKWSPLPEQKGIQWAKLESGQEVCRLEIYKLYKRMCKNNYNYN